MTTNRSAPRLSRKACKTPQALPDSRSDAQFWGRGPKNSFLAPPQTKPHGLPATNPPPVWLSHPCMPWPNPPSPATICAAGLPPYTYPVSVLLLSTPTPASSLGTHPGLVVDAETYPLQTTNRGGGGCGHRDWQKMRKMRKICGKCGKKCDGKCAFVRMVYAPRNTYVSPRLARSGAQSMDGLMEQRSAVVQLKHIMD